MSLQLTPFDPFAHRPGPAAPEPPSRVAAVSSASAAGASANGATGRRASEPPLQASQQAHASRQAPSSAPGSGPDRANAAPSTVSLAQAPVPTPVDPAVKQATEKSLPPISDQLLEFLHSMWKAGAEAITLPKSDEATAQEAAIQAQGAGAATSASARGTDGGRPPGARSAVGLQAPAGQAPAQGSALYDGQPAGGVPAGESLVYSDPTLRRPPGR